MISHFLIDHEEGGAPLMLGKHLKLSILKLGDPFLSKLPLYNLGITLGNIFSLVFMILDYFTIFGIFTLANYLKIFYRLRLLMDIDLEKLV